MGNRNGAQRPPPRPLPVSSTSLKGKRPTNEDAHVVVQSVEGAVDVALFGVFDGHNGVHCATFCRERFPREISKALRKRKRQTGALSVQDITEVFSKVDRKFLAVSDDPPNDSGATAVLALFDRASRTLLVANCGDARAVLGHRRTAIQLSVDHKPAAHDELERIENAGKHVVDGRMDGQLAVSRAIGDKGLKLQFEGYHKVENPYKLALSPIPLVSHTRVAAGDRFLVLGCDGLFDVMSNDEVVAFVCEYDVDDEEKKEKRTELRGDVARALAQHAIDKGSEDNVSVIVVFFGDTERADGGDSTGISSPVAQSLYESGGLVRSRDQLLQTGQERPKDVPPSPIAEQPREEEQ